MSLHIGIVACSAPGAALCYQTVCAEAGAVLGEDRHPEVSVHTHCLGEYMERIENHGWDGVAELMLDSARKLASIGADFAICPDNTIHQCFDQVVKDSPIPWLHIAESVAEEARRRGFERLGITGTRFLMEGPVYPSVLQRHDLACEIPDPEDRAQIHRIIFEELVKNRFTASSRRTFEEIAARLEARGCDAMVMGCTEIPLLVDPESCPLPVLDSTRLLARAAIRKATEGAS